VRLAVVASLAPAWPPKRSARGTEQFGRQLGEVRQKNGLAALR